MLTLYLSDKSSQLNKDIIAYMDTNLATMVKMGLYIDFIVAQARNSQTYTKQGIVNFPTLTYNNTKYVGVDNIKEFFNNYHTNYKKKQTERTEKDDINDYWSNILAKGDEEEGDDAAEQMKAKAMQAVQDRQQSLNSRNPGKVNRSPARPDDDTQSHTKPQGKPSGNQRKSNLEPSAVDVIATMKSGGSGEDAMDDDLMSKFFENQTETSL